MPRVVSEVELEAARVIASPDGGDPARLLGLAGQLKAINKLEDARKVLVKARTAAGFDATPDLRHSILRELALCTYKNQDQPLDDRLTRAAEIIEKELLPDGSLSPPQRQDALGIAGAIYKRRWDSFGLRRHLEKSRDYYRRGMEIGITLDAGYTAINLAFVLDLLAASGTGEVSGLQLSGEAEAIRGLIVNTLLEHVPDPGNFWYPVTLAEAYFGLGRYDEAREWLRKANEEGRRVQPWQLETSARQLAQLARLRAGSAGIDIDALEHSAPWLALKELLGETAASSFLLGKVGLALSGGGFRASLYHIGLLARLAELDMLRHVEVMSCVSGGSIIGAYYYLELRNVLQNSPDSAIDRKVYIEIVDRVQKRFLAGIQKNIRLRMLLGFRSNWKVLTSRRSSMTDRLADIYERELYSMVEDRAKSTVRYLADLKVAPSGDPDFNPKYDNWQRRNKVPILILNATTLNTCHNWQFTVSFMGEPPARGIDNEIDGNNRLRRMYHDQAPRQYREKVRLGEAVAASACVPGLFDPLVFDDLYGTTFDPTRKDSYVTRLVDGGVYDNQGVFSLLEQDCNVLLVSDASGQTGVDLGPEGSRLAVTKRANNILMARVREAQYQQLATLRDAGILRGLLYIHLKKGLEAVPVNWLESPSPSFPAPPSSLTSYGIRHDIQELLASVRTDLDSFSDAEADALMASGYAMTSSEFPKCVSGFPVSAAPPAPWRFRTIEKIVTNPTPTDDLESLKRTLRVAASLFGKPWSVSTPLKAVGLIALLAIAAAAGVALWGVRQRVLQVPVGPAVAWFAVIIGGIALLQALAVRFAKYRNSVLRVVFALLACLCGWFFLRVHLYLIEPFYLRSGPKYR